MAAKHLYTHLQREKDKCSSYNIKEVMDRHSASRGIPVGLVGNHHVDVKKKEEKSFKWKHILKFLRSCRLTPNIRQTCVNLPRLKICLNYV